MATQAEEAMDNMRCVRCGKYSGPESLCMSCQKWDDDHAVLSEEDIPGTPAYDRYTTHLEREGSEPWNDHPDGCWFCGSTHHHSNECPDRE